MLVDYIQVQGGVFGYLHRHFPIASPALLATIVNAALLDAAPGEFQVSYSPTTARFSFQYISASTSCIVVDRLLVTFQ